jgi:hypothetical protein
VGYRILGLQTKADDALQEACLRLSRSDVAAIGNLSRQPRVVFGFTVDRGKIVRIDIVADAKRLRELDVVILAK